ncbi:M24 family metallopeptidase [Saccharibacter sp. 17.LH.SD]|uniref:aminopeptidase P family protein n=1 Tax=Saccharibacter sp. 17.LH.SD TaxID=2689393 RepID=UPI001368EA4E|nr:aminopeptidase P family protein [Saccharibacter sp. 17.LH.SD]MXV43549.1 M24 family metallopeptidase [Saccharibacter sp. 17.LH.SD]
MTSLSTIPLQERPARVRALFSDLSIDGIIVTRGDQYLGEYVAPNAERLAWISGFTGSAGLAILLRDTGCVFSDGRYTVQLEEQVSHDIWERQHILHSPPRDWLKKHAQGLRVGYDPHLISDYELTSWKANGVTLVPVTENPVDPAWTDRPASPAEPISPHPLSYAGETSLEKRTRLAQQLRDNHEEAMIIADCTSLAWLLNIRSHDIAMTPIAHGYGILYADGTVDFFVDKTRLTAPLEDGIRLVPPAQLESHLHNFKGITIRLDPSSTPVWFRMILEKAQATVISGTDLCSLPKAIKNTAEQAGSRRAHELDSLALARFLFWIEANGIGKHETDLAAKLESYRAQSADYRGPSFETISAAGPNGAYPHYRAQVGQDRVLDENSVYLVDSGAQYPFGTTDLTRTLWVGPAEPPAALKEAFTRVLKGNITLSLQRFPQGLPGYRLDTLARASLWNAGLDFDHGTGHGIGSYLSVHEGPQSISSGVRPTGLQAGMIVSNEPGYYAPGHYGIRIENLLLIKESALQSPRGPFLEFEVLSYTPIDRRLITPSLLTDDERTWLNHYHTEVEKRLLPHLEPDVQNWLKKACAPL